MIRAALLVASLFATPVAAQVVSPLKTDTVDTSTLATKAEVQAAASTAAAAKTTADSAVKTVNGTPPNATGAVTVPVPTAATTTPPGVSDTGTIGTMTTMYALANHTHASKARKGRVLVPAAGALDVTFGVPFTSSPPICVVVAETGLGETAIVNAQIDGTPTMTGLRIRITRTQQSVVALIGLTVLSVPSQIATQAHYVCLEP